MRNKAIIWTSDYSNNSGEGILSRIFIKQLLKHNLKFSKSKRELTIIKGSKKKNTLFHKYLNPFYGVYHLLLNRNKHIAYVNYLPLWNFLIFILLPRKTILGPITGGIYSGKVTNLNFFIRKYVFPLFYKFSLFIIYLKFNRVIFSTDILKVYIKNKYLNNTLFNFILLNISQKKKIKKRKITYDLIVYNRDHETKKDSSFSKLLMELNFKKKICVVGDKPSVVNNNFDFKGYVSRKKLFTLLKKSKFALNNIENYYSLFATDALNNQCVVICDKNNLQKKIINNSKNFLDINIKKITNNYYNKYIKNIIFSNNDYFFLNKVATNNKKIVKFISKY